MDFKFCEALFNWLTTTKTCHTNGANKQVQRLKKIVNYAIRCGYISTNPTASYSLEFKPHAKVALQPFEIKALFNLELKRETLRNVRDVFLFQCYTGLAYIDVYRLNRNHVSTEEKGQIWIKMQSSKLIVTNNIYDCLPSNQS